MSRRIVGHLRTHVIAYVALFFALTGGTAFALTGSNTVFSDDITNGQVKSADIGADEVKSPDIFNNGVKTADIADGHVRSPDIQDDAVGSSEVADNAVDSSEVAANAVKGDEIADNAVGSSEIADNAVGSSEIGGNAVRANELGDGIVNRVDSTPTLIPGGAASNAVYNVDTSVAGCNAGEELISGSGQWIPDDNSATDAELFIGEVRLNQTTEVVTVDGGNDSGVDHSLQAVAVCLSL